MKNNVLFVVDNKITGGVSILLEDILNHLSYVNYNVDLLVLHENGDRFVNICDKVNIIYGGKYFNVVDQDFKSLIKKGKLFKALKKIYFTYLLKTGKITTYLKKVREKINLSSYDIEIAFKAGFCSLFVAAGNSTYKYNWIHEDYKSYNKTKRYEKLFKKQFEQFDKHITVSAEARASFLKAYPTNIDVEVIDNYIDGEKIIKESLLPLNEFKYNENKIKFVAVGRFCKEKGFDRLIDAVAILKNANLVSNAIFYILGYGELKDKLNEQIKKNALQDNVVIIDTTKSKDNVYNIMKYCDVYVLSSLSESFGMVRVEALLLGLPVLTTNVGGTKSIIKDKVNGIILQNSTQGLQDGIYNILTDKSLLISLKDNVKNFTYNEKNKIIIQQIENLLERRVEKNN